jgi:hypothetical protein
LLFEVGSAHMPLIASQFDWFLLNVEQDQLPEDLAAQSLIQTQLGPLFQITVPCVLLGRKIR